MVIYNYIYNCSDSVTMNIYVSFHNTTFYFYFYFKRDTFILTIPQFYVIKVKQFVLYHSFPVFNFIILHECWLGVYMLP